MSQLIKVKRIYASCSSEDGHRVLVDRLWPRGISKDRARISEWWKGYAPSTELRKWFGHDPDKWEQFKSAYESELQAQHENIGRSVAQIESQTVTLIYSAKNEQQNQAIVLKLYIEQQVLKTTDDCVRSSSPPESLAPDER